MLQYIKERGAMLDLNIEPVESFWRARCIMPTWGKFCNLSCNARTCIEGCLDNNGDVGGDPGAFTIAWPSRLSGGTKSIRFARWGPNSGLYRSGLDGKLPVNNGDVNGEGNAVAGLENPDAWFRRDNLMPFWAQKVSRERAWWIVLPESGLYEDSTSSTMRLQPNEGLFSSSPGGKDSSNSSNLWKTRMSSSLMTLKQQRKFCYDRNLSLMVSI